MASDRCERCDRPESEHTTHKVQHGEWVAVCPGPAVDWRARARAAADDLARVTRERDALVAEHADVMTVLHQYQPGGSPPAGDVLLAQWTLETLARERDAARALAASNAETMRACSREATELDRQLGASRAREAALREAIKDFLAETRGDGERVQYVEHEHPTNFSEREWNRRLVAFRALLAKEST